MFAALFSIVGFLAPGIAVLAVSRFCKPLRDVIERLDANPVFGFGGDEEWRR